MTSTSRSPTSPDLLIGRTIGTHYVISQVLGRGPMSATYLAEHRTLHRNVVLKILDVPWAGDAESANRFEQSARSLSTLEAPNIAGLVDFGRDPGRGVFVVSEYVEGETLEHFLNRVGPVALDDFVPIAAQILKGMGAAHLRGLYHLDLKPGNVVLSYDDKDSGRGIVRLLELGLIQAIEGHLVGADEPVLGSDPGYLAPEQVERRPLDTRTDVYQVGTLFYRMLAGRPPFPGKGPQVMQSQVHDDPPALRELVPNFDAFPEDLITLIEDCLAKDPDDRPIDANEVVERLIDSVPAALFRAPVPAPESGGSQASASTSAEAVVRAPVLPDNLTESHDSPVTDDAQSGRRAAAIGDLALSEPPSSKSAWNIDDPAAASSSGSPSPSAAQETVEEEKKGGGGAFIIVLVLLLVGVGVVFFLRPDLLGLRPPGPAVQPQPQPATTAPPVVAPSAPDVAALLVQAQSLEAGGDRAGATALYQQILAQEPGHSVARDRLAALQAPETSAGATPEATAATTAIADPTAAEAASAGEGTTTTGGEEDGTTTGAGDDATTSAAVEAPAAGKVEVEFKVKPKAKLLVDGKAVGSVPGKIELPLGKHTLAIEANRYETWTEKVEVVPGMAPFDVKLKRKARDLSSENVEIDPAEEGPVAEFKIKPK